jgi:hypothetical protein
MSEKVNIKRICVLIVYYGEFPNSIKIWYDSAKRQKNIDFIFVTDQEQPSFLINFKWIKYTFPQLVDHINHTLNIDCKIESAYKLCDLKPAYGLIFKNIVDKYDYWGYCDIDLIFGNLNLFLKESLKDTPDLIYSRGHFTLYKNSFEINNLFKTELLLNNRQTGYAEIFSKYQNCLFDETYGIFKIFRNQNKIIYHNNNFIDINCNGLRFRSTNSTNYHFQFYVYHKGKIVHFFKSSFFEVYSNIEYSYIHFQKRNIDFSKFTNSNSYYLIKSDKIIPFESIETLIDSNVILFDINLKHFIKRFVDRILKKIGLRKFNFDNYLNTGSNY